MKITISMDKELHKKAKKYASETGRTFSGLVEVGLNKILGEENENLLVSKLLREKDEQSNVICSEVKNG
jgi:lysyl-tRNA synthetase class I